MQTEPHPFEPFLPANAKVLMLGSFPPQEKRWSIKFYYPNFINDMWRIIGLVFFGDKDRFVDAGARKFKLDDIRDFCTSAGIAMYDTACEVRRLKDNASFMQGHRHHRGKGHHDPVRVIRGCPSGCRRLFPGDGRRTQPASLQDAFLFPCISASVKRKSRRVPAAFRRHRNASYSLTHLRDRPLALAILMSVRASP